MPLLDKDAFIPIVIIHTPFSLPPLHMDYSQKITLLAHITVHLNVPELQNKDQLNQWIKSDAARIHFIDHLKPASFNNLEVIEAASEATFLS